MSGHMSQNLASIVPLSMNINDLSLHLHIQKISSISIQEVAENFMWKNFFFWLTGPSGPPWALSINHWCGVGPFLWTTSKNPVIFRCDTATSSKSRDFNK